MKKLIKLLIITAVLSGFLFGVTMVSAAGPVKFKAVAFLPVNNANVAGFNIFVKNLNEKFKDSISIEILGGPEVTPPFQLHEAVKKGVIDMCLTSCGYYPSLLWEAQSAMFTNKDYKEIAETEYFNQMSKLHEKVGLVWLGAGTFNLNFYLYSNPQINIPKDLSGKKIRVFPALIPFVKALGSAPINLPMGDIYTAMERGAVDGFMMTQTGFVSDFSWHEVTKHVIAYPLYQATAVILANQKKWNSLPINLRKEIIAFKQSTIDPAISEYYAQLDAKSWKELMDSGVKSVKFSKAEGEAFMKLAYDSAWDQVISKSPDLGPKLKKMLVK